MYAVAKVGPREREGHPKHRCGREETKRERWWVAAEIDSNFKRSVRSLFGEAI